MKDNFLSSFFRSIYQLLTRQTGADNAVQRIGTTDSDGMYAVKEEIKTAQRFYMPRKNNFIKLQLTGDKDSNLQTAKWLAARQRQELYKIDLGKIVSKYIGETEKNLAAIFNKAESKDWVLFFDEADALFGKRSEVKDAHDRYANTDANYLLQRIKQYKGTVLINCITNECREWKIGVMEQVKTS